MRSVEEFRRKLAREEICLGTVITFADPVVTEALSNVVDFVWIDMEHNPMSLAAVQGHIMATKGTDVLPIVRVPWNDPVLIKPVLDIGAYAIIVPLIRTADDVRRAVAACRYPPEGIRGFGPRRPSNYGLKGGPDFCRRENESIFVAVQIEHRDAVENIDEILKVPGLASVVIGPNDLAGSMGLMGQPTHPQVLEAVSSVVSRAREAGIFVGIGSKDDPEVLLGWYNRGIQWLSMGGDFSLLLKSAIQISTCIREHVSGKVPQR